MLIKVSEASDAVLDWMVAKCEGHQWRCPWMLKKDGYKAWQSYEAAWGNPTPSYSTDWEQGGPIIEREGINTFRYNRLNDTVPHVWCAHKVVPRPNMEGSTNMVAITIDGPTPLIAAMRCYVSSILGDEFDIPEELLT